MKKSIFIIKVLILTLFINTGLKSQSISEIINNNRLNYYEKVNQIEKNKGNKNFAVEAELKRYKRWRAFWDSRVDKNGNTDTYAVQWHKILSLKQNIKTGSKSLLPQWQFIGPVENSEMKNKMSEMGRVESIASDPNNANIIYAGSNSGGLWKCENPTSSNPHWVCLTDNYFGMGVYDIAINPLNTNIIYIATGLYANGLLKHGYYGLGIYKTTDGGITWNQIMPLSPQELILTHNIVMDPANPNILYATGNNKVYKTTDAGQHWTTTIIPSANNGFNYIVINPDNTHEIYISGNAGLYKSTNSGSSWNKILSLGNITTNINIAYNPVNKCIYALYRNTPYWTGTLKKSCDGGETWELINNRIRDVAPYISRLEIAPNGNIYAGGIVIYRSSDDGINFKQQIKKQHMSMHPDVRDIFFTSTINDNLAYIATDGGVVMRTNGADDGWFSINGDLCVSQFYSVSSSNTDPEFIIGGTHDCGTLRKSTSGNWSHVLGSDGGSTLINPYITNKAYAVKGSGDEVLKRSEDGGKTWQKVGVYLLDVPTHNIPLVISSTAPGNVIYVGTTDMYNSEPRCVIKISNDYGDNWQNFTPLKDGFGDINAIAISKSNPNIVYYSKFHRWTDENFILKTENYGSSWNLIRTDTDSTRVSHIVVNPDNSDEIWITYCNFDTNKKVLKTKDGGNSWINLSNGLPNLPVNCIVYDNNSNYLYAGTDAGVYYRKNNVNSQWFPFDNNIPKTIISDLHINNLGYLTAATYGRGIWRAELQGYCYNGSTLYINSNQTWNTDRTICSNITINSGCTLTVTANITIPFLAKIHINNGGTLIINGGSLINSDIVAQNGSKIILENNGILEICNNDNLTINNGAEFDLVSGEIK